MSVFLTTFQDSLHIDIDIPNLSLGNLQRTHMSSLISQLSVGIKYVKNLNRIPYILVNRPDRDD